MDCFQIIPSNTHFTLYSLLWRTTCCQWKVLLTGLKAYLDAFIFGKFLILCDSIRGLIILMSYVRNTSRIDKHYKQGNNIFNSSVCMFDKSSQIFSSIATTLNFHVGIRLCMYTTQLSLLKFHRILVFFPNTINKTHPLIELKIYRKYKKSLEKGTNNVLFTIVYSNYI